MVGEFEWIFRLPKDLIHLPPGYTWVNLLSKFQLFYNTKWHFFIYILIIVPFYGVRWECKIIKNFSRYHEFISMFLIF